MKSKCELKNIMVYCSIILHIKYNNTSSYSKIYLIVLQL